jgi:predicted metal-dependent HD superfamily phosphohydrolase
MKQAYHAANVVDAQLLVDLLASEGISAFTQGQYLSGDVGELPAGELLRVWVADEDADRARAVIAGRDAQGPLLDDAIDPALARSWARAWPGLGASHGGIALRDRLLAAWAEPQRRYHTVRHLGDCIALFEATSHLAAHPCEVEIALWFHDAIYDLEARDNEARSAAWAERELSAASVGADVRARVHDLVMATCHAALPATDDARLLVDIDLSILGAEAERFDEYEVQVRQEYAWVPGPEFRHKRREILQGFLARPHIYATEWFQRRFEAVARNNLQRSVARLRPWYARFLSTRTPGE